MNTNTNTTREAWVAYARNTGYDEDGDGASTWGDDELGDWAWAEICAWFANENSRAMPSLTDVATWAHNHTENTGNAWDISDDMVDMAMAHAERMGYDGEFSVL
jgi:hypothetical protein